MRTRIGWIGLLIFLIVAGCRRGGNDPNLPDQGTIVARVTAYNEAKLSGDIGRKMRVIFDNTSHSSGRISEGNTAIMTIQGLPDGWITNITIWMRSNKNSGAGSISVIMGDTVLMSLSGTYADWVGSYSDTNKPISTHRQAWPCQGEDIVLTIVGEVNSLYLDRMEISYSDKQPIFPPEEQDTTFITMVQDTSWVSGEYAMVCKLKTQYMAMKGGWVDGKYMLMDSIDATENEAGMVQWKAKKWPEDMRYQIDFDEDSVTIYLACYNEYIGHRTKNASPRISRWAWDRAADGSIFIHHGMNWHDGGSAQFQYWLAYSFYLWPEDDDIVAKYTQIQWNENNTYWKLMKEDEGVRSQ